MVAISNGILIFLLCLQNISAQGVNSNVVNNAASSQQRTACNSAAGINYSPQPGQQINWQQSNTQQDPQQPQTFLQQPGVNTQLQNQSPVTEIFSALHNLRFPPQSSQIVNPTSSGYRQIVEQTSAHHQPSPTNNLQYNQCPESPKPAFTFQFVPVSQNKAPENQVQNTIPVQFLTSGQSQIASQQGPSYFVQNPTTIQASSPQSSKSGQSQPIVFAVNPQQQSSGQNQPMVYALQPAQQSSRSNQNAPNPTHGQNKPSDPMALLMSQLQSSSGNPDISSILPLLMNSKQEKSSGMKAMLPLIMNLLSDRGCGCPHCGCPYNNNNAEPTIHGGYSNQIDYSQLSLPKNPVIPEFKNKVNFVEESNEAVINAPKEYKTNVITDLSEETSEEEDDYDDEYED